jgi:chromate transporter
VTELARLFLKLGLIAFGGPAAHIAMMEEEVVERRRWVSRQRLLDLIGATSLIPGPNSTELAMHIGYERAGRQGAILAGACFIGPAALVTLAFAVLYVRWGTLPELEAVLYGIKPAVIAIILMAVWRLGQKAVTGWTLAVIGMAVAAAVLVGASEIAALAAGGVIGMLWIRTTARSGSGGVTSAGFLPLTGVRPGLQEVAGGVAIGATVATVSLWKLGLFFLKVGAVLYGSGYVLVAFLRGDLVERYGWLTEPQLLDAIAIGQFTPGPVLSTATFVGYVVAGWAGALVATLAIFLPSFVFVMLLNPLVAKLRESAWSAAFLDAINAASVGLMAAVLLQLGATTLVSWPAWVIAGLAAVASWRFRVNAVWLVAGGAGIGWILRAWT